jgi:DNA-directed RNA polymerase sigma subunit (sigma70/sigma32)
VPQVAAGGGGDPADRESALHGYFREVRPIPTLTAAEVVALAKAIETHTTALRQGSLGIPLTARFLVSRWRELCRANRVTATLSAVPAGRRESDASTRMDQTMSRVAALLDRRAGLNERRDPRSEAEHDRIRQIERDAIQRLRKHAEEGALPGGILHDGRNECAPWKLTREARGQAR